MFWKLYYAYFLFIRNKGYNYVNAAIYAFPLVVNALWKKQYWILGSTKGYWCDRCKYVFHPFFGNCPLCGSDCK